MPTKIVKILTARSDRATQPLPAGEGGGAGGAVGGKINMHFGFISFQNQVKQWRNGSNNFTKR